MKRCRRGQGSLPVESKKALFAVCTTILDRQTRPKALVARSTSRYVHRTTVQPQSYPPSLVKYQEPTERYRYVTVQENTPGVLIVCGVWYLMPPLLPLVIVWVLGVLRYVDELSCAVSGTQQSQS